MEHKEFIAGLPAPTRAALHRRADAPGLRHLAGHGGLILGFGFWIGLGLPFWQLLLLPQGIALCFLFTLEHEATHRTPFASPRLNEWAGRISGTLIALPFEWFRYFHLAHHRHTNDPARDPELLAGGAPETKGAYLVHISGLPYWIDMLDRIIGSAFGRDPGDFVPDRARPRVIREARVMMGLYGLALASLWITPLLFWVWWLPCLLGQPFLRLYLLAEHGRCAFVADMFRNTRTTFTNRAVRFLAWNMPYHVEHHTLPQVPFHRLPDLHALLSGRHAVTAPGYARFSLDHARAVGTPRPCAPGRSGVTRAGTSKG